MITNLIKLNQCQATPRFKGDYWKEVMHTISQPQWQWGLTLDLKDYFHHLALHPSTQRWMRIQLEGAAYQIQAMPFGWAASPWWAHKMSLPVRSWLNQRQIPFAWWVDDILILGRTREETLTHSSLLVQQLTRLGLRVNVEKSMQEPLQEVLYLGHRLNFKENLLIPVGEKLLKASKAIKKQLKASTCQPKNLASLSGLLLDMVHSNVRFQGLPQQLMSHAGRLALRSAQALQLQPHHPKAWGSSVSKPPELKPLLHQALAAAQNPVPRIFRAKEDAPKYRLQTDASDQGWGAILELVQQGKWKKKQTMQNKWDFEQREVHITKREALASVLAMQVALKVMPQGAQLLLQSDASSTCWCWKKGSKNKGMNSIILPMVCKAHQQKVHLEVQHIAGQLNVKADYLSRNMDPKNYHLKRAIFSQVCEAFKFFPTIDLFANQHNRQCLSYCSWHQDGDPHNRGNAWDIKWKMKRAFLNPPWELIHRCLKKVGDDGCLALECLPLWRTASWWPLLLQLQVAPLITFKGKSLFQDPKGRRLGPPRWGTLFTIVAG